MTMKKEITKYTHLELNKEVAAPSGYYTPQKEVRLKYNGREVFYTVSEAVVESSCCGADDFSTAQVPGYVISWQSEKSKDGLPVSLVEPITDEPTRAAVRELIKEKEHISQIEFR
jgi:hypothetical protein